MPRGRRGEKRPADVIGVAVATMRIHKTLKVTPAMAAGVSDRLWSVEVIVAPIDARTDKPVRPATYQPRKAAISN